VTKPRPARGFVVFRWCVYAILAFDVALYARYGRATEFVDTAAWLLLLLLFELETAGWPVAPRLRPVLRGFRLLAGLAIAFAVGGYAIESEWLDFANEATWLGVVALLELEVRLPAAAQALHRWRRRIAGLLYVALVGFLAAWAVQGAQGADPAAARLDAWDAFWWLVAFVAIELNLFGVRSPSPAAGTR
jgi:hypothetical protein